jgi:hypothetical protein
MAELQRLKGAGDENSSMSWLQNKVQTLCVMAPADQPSIVDKLSLHFHNAFKRKNTQNLMNIYSFLGRILVQVLSIYTMSLIVHKSSHKSRVHTMYFS